MNFLEAIQEVDKGNKVKNKLIKGEIYKGINHLGFESLYIDKGDYCCIFYPTLKEILSEDWELLD